MRIEHEENKLLSFTDATQGRLVFPKMSGELRGFQEGGRTSALFSVLFLFSPPAGVHKA
jgi:hypothetical protein